MTETHEEMSKKNRAFLFEKNAKCEANTKANKKALDMNLMKKKNA